MYRNWCLHSSVPKPTRKRSARSRHERTEHCAEGGTKLQESRGCFIVHERARPYSYFGLSEEQCSKAPGIALGGGAYGFHCRGGLSIKLLRGGPPGVKRSGAAALWHRQGENRVCDCMCMCASVWSHAQLCEQVICIVLAVAGPLFVCGSSVLDAVGEKEACVAMCDSLQHSTTGNAAGANLLIDVAPPACVGSP